MTDDNRLAALVQELSAKLATANKALNAIAMLPIAVAPDGGPCDRCGDAHDIARAALKETTR